MLWFLNRFPHSRELEHGIHSLNRLLLTDLTLKSTKTLTAEVGAVPPPVQVTAGWLSHRPLSRHRDRGAFFKFMHILLSSNIKCFFFFIVTSACFDCQHFRSQITKARL